MTSERYELLCQLFDRARQCIPADLEAFLHGACAGDPSLRAELEQLLAHDQQARAEQLFQDSCPVNAAERMGRSEDDEAATEPFARPTRPGIIQTLRDDN
jgi:hypothetical protein